jgi:hypothetical protein
MGVLPFESLNMEVGFDWLEPTDHPLSFNAKVGISEIRFLMNLLRSTLFSGRRLSVRWRWQPLPHCCLE